MQLGGLHHVTAITSDAKANKHFYTDVLGLRLVKKTVNQDDVSAYHLFYADGLASPGSDLTFFEWPVPRERRGTRSVAATGLRVTGEAALAWWHERLRAAGVEVGAIGSEDGRASLPFADPEGQRLRLVDDRGDGEGTPWDRSPVPPNFQIRGLGPVELAVPVLEPTAAVLTHVMGMTEARRFTRRDGTQVHVFAMAGAGPASELHVVADRSAPPARQGAGGVHHVAFRVADAAYDAWVDRLAELGVPTSGPVDRFYFRSLYFREPSGILFEIATDGPGFATDEPLATLGETLALPPFLEPRRREIEAGLAPL